MALTTTQIQGLETAYKRKKANWANSPQSKQTDIRNLDYATSKNLWQPKKNQSSFTDVKSFAGALKGNLMNKFNKGEIGQKAITPVEGVHSLAPYSSPTGEPPKPKITSPSGSGALNGEVIKQTTPTPTALQTMQQKYLDSLKQTEKEISLQEKLNKQLETTETGVEKIEAKPILNKLLWGQKERLLKQSGIATGGLQRQLALEQAKRTGTQQQLGQQIGWGMQAEAQRLTDERAKQQLEFQKEQTAQQQQFKVQQEEMGFKRDLALSGYQKISDPNGLTGLTEADIIRMPNGDIYKKPAVETITTSDFGVIGKDEEGNDMYGFIDKTTNTVIPLSATNEATYTDGSGAINNVAGWALNDTTKVASMQQIANQIGKVTEENIYDKVAQFTPGITAEMIKNASADYGVSWESIMTQVVQEASGGLSSVAQKNNNFGGLTASSTNQGWYQQFNGSVGTARPVAEGGNYISFATKQDGINALASLQSKYNQKTTPQEVVDQEVAGYVELVKNGKLKPTQALDDISKNKKDDLAIELSKTPVPKDTLQDTIAKEKSQLALNLKTHKGFDPSVGIGAGRIAVPWRIAEKQDFIAGVQQLVSGLSLEALIEAKSRGATFGALSDTEMQILSSAATKIGTWMIRDESGKVKGYKTSHNAMKKELENISKTLLRATKEAETGETGTIRVQKIETGETGTIPANEFNKNLYKKI